MIGICKNDFTQRPGETHHPGFRKFSLCFIPDVGNVVMAKGMFNKLPGKNTLIFTYRDLNVRGVGQNNLLHANLMANKVSTKPTKMTVNGT